jgi:hypothetical protein
VNEQIKLIRDFLRVSPSVNRADHSSSRRKWCCTSRGRRSPLRSLTTRWKRWKSSS